MSKRLRHFVLWLLMAWLPVQGMAAAVMRPCAMAHRGMSNASVNVSGPCNESAMALETKDVAQVDLRGSDVQDHSTQSSAHKHSCSHCAGCTFGAFAPPSVAAFASTGAPSSDVLLPSSDPFTGFISARIERPPRYAASFAG